VNLMKLNKAKCKVLHLVTVQQDLNHRNSLLYPERDKTKRTSNADNQTDLLITYSNKGTRNQEQDREEKKGKRGKNRKERNLVSSWDRVARDSHHHGSRSLLLVRSSCVHQWWWVPLVPVCVGGGGVPLSFGRTAFYKVFGEVVP